MKVALLGLAQAGKKSLFELLTGRGVPAARKPDEAVEGAASVKDRRVDALAEICQPRRTVYAENRFVLCPDVPFNERSRGWLDSARKCDLLCLVVRAFPDNSVYHPAGGVDAARDKAYLESEVLLADMEIVEKRLDRLAKEKRGGLRPDQQVEEIALGKTMRLLEAGRPAREASLTEAETAAVSSLELITFLPVLAVLNVAEKDLATPGGSGALAVSCLIEREIMGIEDPGERQAFLEAAGLDSSGLDRMNAAVYDALGLMSFYTTGKDECRAWTIRKGATAPFAAGRIHSDLQRGFIRVEVVKFDDFVEAGSEAKAREHGKMQTRGRDYVIEDGDICHFLFNV
jgi:GTP-binding protein YchF